MVQKLYMMKESKSVMKKYLKNFLRYKYLLTELVKKNIKLKYRRSYLGILWTLIEPLLTMLVLTLVFGTFFGNNDEQYPVYILSGRLLYSFFHPARNPVFERSAVMLQ